MVESACNNNLFNNNTRHSRSRLKDNAGHTTIDITDRTDGIHRRQETLIKPHLYHFFQLIGMYPRSTIASLKLTPNARNSENVILFSINPLLVFFSSAVVLLSLAGFITKVMSSWEDISKQIADLEFFTLVNFVFLVSDYSLALLAFLLMVHNSSKLIPLVTAIEHFLNEMVPRKEVGKIRLVTYYCLIWHITCILVLSLAEYQQLQPVLGPGSPLKWVSKLEFPLAGIWSVEIPIYAIWIWQLIFTILTTNFQSAQYLLVILVISIARVCNHIQRNINTVTGNTLAEYQVSLLQESRWRFRKVKSLVNKLNDFFSFIVLTSCLRDLITCISFIATMLYQLIKEDNESDEDFLMRYYQQQLGLTLVYTQTSIGLFNAICRLTAMLYCYGQESAIRRIIQDLQADTRGNVVDDQCSLFLSELSGTDTAISGGGFFYITKEYLAAMLGLLLTYTILIYQTRDSKGDMSELIKSEALKNHLNRLSSDFQTVVANAVANLTKTHN